MKVVQLRYSDVPHIREEILAEQEGLCPICERPCTRPVLDHHHIKRNRGTGHIRGVLCATCNTFLAKIENNVTRYKLVVDKLPEILHNCAEYLGKDDYPYIHPSEAKRYKR